MSEPLSDDWTAERLRDPAFRAGYLEGQLETARDEIQEALPHMPPARRVLTQMRIDGINRTLRLLVAAGIRTEEQP
jgi:hypothetical protein